MNYDLSPRNSPILPDLRIQSSTLTQNKNIFLNYNFKHKDYDHFDYLGSTFGPLKQWLETNAIPTWASISSGDHYSKNTPLLTSDHLLVSI